MLVWLYSDDNATGTSTDLADEWNANYPDGPLKNPVDFEYECLESEIRLALKDLYPSHLIRFARGKMPNDLSSGRPDIYAWDIGGMDGFQLGGGTYSRRAVFSHQLKAMIQDRPNTIFIPMTALSAGSMRAELEDELTENQGSDEIKIPHNLVLTEKSGFLSSDELCKILMEKLDAKKIKKAFLRPADRASKNDVTPVFFNPDDSFLQWVKSFAESNFGGVLDAGCGRGDLTKRLRAIGCKTLGADIYQQWDVEDLKNANSFLVQDLTKGNSIASELPLLILICRPSHSGWVMKLIENAHPQSVIIYISTKTNLKIDIDIGKDHCVESVVSLAIPGMKKERAWQIIRRDPIDLVKKKKRYEDE